MRTKSEQIINIATIVAQYYGMTLEEMCIKTKKRQIVEARQIAHYLCDLNVHTTYSLIGHLIGSKDHATVLHSKVAVSNLIETNKHIREDVEYLNLKIIKYNEFESGVYIRMRYEKSLALKHNRAARKRELTLNN